jgi:nucleoside-diphosphate-sugar epimerase
MRVLVAGAGGVIGRRLVPQLVARGHEVVGTTANPWAIEAICKLGGHAAVMDGLDAVAVGQTVARAEPEVIVGQARGMRNLLAAASAVGVGRFVAGSCTCHVEQAVASAPVAGLVLRYGTLYGPGTCMAREYAVLIRTRKLPIVGNGAEVCSFVHADDAAAAAAALAVEGGPPGVYEIVDDEPAPVAVWLPYLAACLGAPPPRREPGWLARFKPGGAGISPPAGTGGASNEKARRELGWDPLWRTWRDGFRHGDVTDDWALSSREAWTRG